eukprot:g9226.t1
MQDAVKQETGIRMREQRFIDGTRELQEDEPLKDQLHLTLIRRPTEQVLLLQALEDSHHPKLGASGAEGGTVVLAAVEQPGEMRGANSRGG